jgi:RNA polymerase sigma-70 factor (ECF subfamily)
VKPDGSAPARYARSVPDVVSEVFRAERARVLATVIRLVGGDFDLAEEVVQEAFASAAEGWPNGVPDNPRAWLVRAAHLRAIDQIRRRVRMRRIQGELERDIEPAAELELEAVGDDRLRLLFTCCHPALAREAQVALTLHTLCGLETTEIARAFLVSQPTMAQRLVRAKTKIRSAGIPYEVPEASALAERLDAVMTVVYLVFNEGYAATHGEQLVRRELCQEAIRLGRLLVELMPEEPEPRGLLALMLLHDARWQARVDAGGELVLLEEQRRTLWNRAQIDEGRALVTQALRGGGAYAIQAAIAALHAEAPSPEQTDWPQIVGLYRALHDRTPSPIVALNHAVAVAMAFGMEQGLRGIDALAAELDTFHVSTRRAPTCCAA